MKTLQTMVSVASSAIRGIGYDPAAQVLYVEFPSGSTWTYKDVPPDAHAALMGAESIGKHFAQHVRGQYVGEPLPAESEGGEP